MAAVQPPAATFQQGTPHRFIVRKEYFGGFVYDRHLGKTVQFLDPSEYEELVSAPSPGANVDKLRTRWEQQGLIQNGLVHADVVDDLPIEAGLLSAPIIAYVHLTFRCNLRCAHCMFNEKGGRNVELSAEELEDRVFVPLRQMGCGAVRLTGGEPTVRKDLLEIIRSARNNGLYVAMNSNGVFGLGMRERLAESGVRELVVSLDGDKCVHEQQRGPGSFQRTLDSLRFFADRDVQVTINATISKRNVDLASYFVGLAREVNASITFNPLRPLGEGKNIADDMLSTEQFKAFTLEVADLAARNSDVSIKNYNLRSPLAELTVRKLPYPFDRSTCAAATYGMGVLPNGDGNVCGYFAEIDELRAPNVREHSLIDIWHSEPFRRFREPVTGTCGGCSRYQTSCIGTCKAVSYAETGKLVQYDRYCVGQC